MGDFSAMRSKSSVLRKLKNVVGKAFCLPSRLWSLLLAPTYVEVTADMDVLFIISNCPQVNNPCNGFDPTPIRVMIWNPPET